MGLETFAALMVAICWAACAFLALNLRGVGARRGRLAVGLVVATGIVVIVLRTGSPGLGWLRSYALTSDAIALGAVVPMLATCTGVLAARTLQQPWALTTALVASLSCTGAGFAALALGRGGWHWEFIAIITAGAATAVLGLARAAHRGGPSANERIVLGAVGAFGCFLTVGGTLLGIAWNSLA